ncbi:MAG: transglycosylase domain-containing protein [Spirochaetes bacterium]|nr:transglycosylase domain-containing protein [Spirochaetota bacterium]
MQAKLKKWIIRIILFFLITGILALIGIGIYTGIVYIEFLSSRDSIFSKIEEFSRAMQVQDETNITLGVDEAVYNKPTYIYDRNNNIIAKYTPEKHRLVDLKQLPYFLTRGFLLIEDKAFYKHNGINYRTFVTATIRYFITLGRGRGGSTISQQLAKILFTKHERSVKRKIYEVFCTRELEKRFNKDQILKIYLNSIYMGHGTYGIANATNFYFGKTPEEITVAEAALIIGMNRSPEIYSPIRNREKAQYVQKLVLNEMKKVGFIDQPNIDIEIKRFWEQYDNKIVEGVQSFWKTEINKSGYLTEQIRRILDEEFEYEKITRGGLIVETTFDLEKQLLAESIVARQIKSIRSKTQDLAKKNKLNEYNEELINKLEAGFLSLNYETGEVFTLVGGSGYNFANQLNRVTQTRRQIGSSVKPFIYAYALNQEKIEDLTLQPFSKFKDEVVTYKINGKKYTPKNYSRKASNEMVTLYQAVKESLNTIACKVLNHLEFEEVATFIQNASNISEKEKAKRIPAVLSLALGTCELSVKELAAAYALFPRMGKSVYPIMIRRISDVNGNVYYDINRENNQFFNWLYPTEYREEKQLLEPETSFEILQMLQGVFEEGGSGYWPAYKTGLTKRAFGKSGTSQDYRDGWFAGFTNNEVVTVWVGIDTNQSILLSGSSTAGMIWCEYNARVTQDIERIIPIPTNMKLVSICTETGLIANKNCPDVKRFYFKRNRILPEPCYVHQSTDDFSPLEDEDVQ